MARAYITPAEFRAMPLGIKGNYSDEQLQQYIEVATANVEAFTERIFTSAYYTETFRGDGSLTYLAYQYPLINVVSLKQSSIEETPVVTTYSTDRLVLTSNNVDVSRIELDGAGEFSSFSTSYIYELQYRAGYSTIPPVVKHATALWASELIKPDFAGASLEVPEIVPFSTQQIVELLAPLRRRRI